MNMKLTPNFSKSEFDSKDGSPMPPEVFERINELARNLQVLRDELGQPITITSGYRSPAHNAAVGGATRSQHLYGTAADFKVKNTAAVVVAETIERLISEGRMIEGGLKAYSSWTHYDVRGTKARW